MYYTDREIVGAYRRAENKKKIIKILAELNGCPTDEILEVLDSNGYKMKQGKRRDTTAAISRAAKRKAEKQELIKKIKAIQFQNLVKLQDEEPAKLAIYIEAYTDLLIRLDKED